jgi:hypothetical protein
MPTGTQLLAFIASFPACQQSEILLLWSVTAYGMKRARRMSANITCHGYFEANVQSDVKSQEVTPTKLVEALTCCLINSSAEQVAW